MKYFRVKYGQEQPFFLISLIQTPLPGGTMESIISKRHSPLMASGLI